MKKVLYVLVMLVVVLLPSLGHSQERTGNETVPAYTLWLPVVRMPPIPSECLVTQVVARFANAKPGGNQYYPILAFVFRDFTYESYESMLAGNGNVKGEATIAYDSQMQNIVSIGIPSTTLALPIFELGIPDLTPGQTYYTKFEYECLGYSVRTSVHEFTAPVPD